MSLHGDYIDKRIADFRKQQRWQSYVCGSHDCIIRDYGTCLFTNLVRSTFTNAYLKKHKCPDCGGSVEQRCHGIDEDRPLLIRRALERIYPDTTKNIQMIEIVVAFLEEHKTTAFTFKCTACHKKEPRPNRKKNFN